MISLPVIEPRSARGRAGNAVRAGKKRPAYEDEMPADGTIAARSLGEDFGTSRFEGSWAARYRICA
jgi:hypothetical protein